MILDEFIQYRDVKHGGEFQRLHVKCREVAYIASILSKTLFNEQLNVTSIFRKKTTDSGIHEQFRAIDFKPLSKEEYTYRLIEMINLIYTYDPKRPNLKVAAENPYHGTGQHIHIQVHDNTTGLSPDRIEYFKLLAKNDAFKFKPQALV